MKFVNNAGLEMEVLERKGKYCTVLFLGTGSVRKAQYLNVTQGKVRDLYHPSRYGVGYNGEVDKTKPHWRRARDLWSNMLKRCYCEKATKGYYGTAFVDARWNCFANFLEDIETLPGFDDWLANRGMELDKDRSGTRVYSKETCMFLSAFDNRSQQPNYRVGKKFCRETRRWVADSV